MTLSKCYSMNEKEQKKKQYNKRILQVKYNAFTKLVMSSNGGSSRKCARFYS